MLAAHGLRVERGGRAVLAGLDLALAAGEVLALMGPNGAGKSTFLGVLLGGLPLAGGKLTLFGRPLPWAARHGYREVGVAFQAPSLDGDLTVLENLRLGAALWGAWGAAVRARATDLMARLGLGPLAGERVRRLSGGQRRRLELARALVHRPRLLLLDEPGAGLDPRALAEFWAVVLALVAEEGLAVLATTHLAEEAGLAHRVAIMDHGRVVVEAAPRALVAALGGERLSLSAADPEAVAARLGERLGLHGRVAGGRVHLLLPGAVGRVPDIAAAVAGLEVSELAVGGATLAEVFLHHTGRALPAAARP